MLTIRWHSRAGQGGVTVANALGEIAGALGWHVQSFPEFSAEKRGPPVVVYNRLDTQPITDVSKPQTLDYVLLLDSTLVSSGEVPAADILAGLGKAGTLIANTKQAQVKFSQGVCKVAVVDASEISRAEIGRHIPNVPMLGALIKLTKLASLSEFSIHLEKYLAKGLSPQLVAGNLKAFARGYNEVKLTK